MLSEQVEKFRNSGQTFTAAEILEAHETIKQRLISGWIDSSSGDGDGREALYRQLRGLDSILVQLVAGWSK